MIPSKYKIILLPHAIIYLNSIRDGIIIVCCAGTKANSLLIQTLQQIKYQVRKRLPEKMHEQPIGLSIILIVSYFIFPVCRSSRCLKPWKSRAKIILC
jgi:uncharacterized membrane protein SpoIIM required for sporulation